MPWWAKVNIVSAVGIEPTNSANVIVLRAAVATKLCGQIVINQPSGLLKTNRKVCRIAKLLQFVQHYKLLAYMLVAADLTVFQGYAGALLFDFKEQAIEAVARLGYEQVGEASATLQTFVLGCLAYRHLYAGSEIGTEYHLRVAQLKVLAYLPM